MLTELHPHGEFTGTVLVSKADAVVFHEAIASSPAEARTLLSGHSNIASLAKAFTAMAVMIQAQRGKLRYSDLIAAHVPELSGTAPGVTIRHLLTHTSGIPDVGDLGIDHPRLREREVVSAIRTNHSRFEKPGTRYRYSNTGYILLAMALENTSGQTFDRFLQTTIFDPLGMRNTRPESGLRPEDEAKGEGGLVSTAGDLLKWHQALSQEKLLPAKAFREALEPGRVTTGQSTYGFGWNVTQRDGAPYMWHTGNSGAERAFLGRLPQAGIAIIVLTKGNSRRTEIADAIINILHDRPFHPPKLSIARRLVPVIRERGVDAGIALYQQLRTAEPARFDFSEQELNGLGYALLEQRRPADAIRIFELNLRQFPNSANAFDSLGDAFHRHGKRTEAVKAYSRAVELDPSNANAREKLSKLK